jgi:hypothetical protein
LKIAIGYLAERDYRQTETPYFTRQSSSREIKELKETVKSKRVECRWSGLGAQGVIFNTISQTSVSNIASCST